LEEFTPPPPPLITYSTIKRPSPRRRFLFTLAGVSFVLAVSGLALFLSTRQEQQPSPKQPPPPPTQQKKVAQQPVRVAGVDRRKKPEPSSPREPAVVAEAAHEQPPERQLEGSASKPATSKPKPKAIRRKKARRGRRAKYALYRSRRRARARIRRLLRRNGKRVIRCVRRHRRRRRARVGVRVEVLPAGQAGKIILRGRHSKTAVGDCVRSTLRSTKYPRFRGRRPLKCTYLYVVR
jgi:hypothetical protein